MTHLELGGLTRASLVDLNVLNLLARASSVDEEADVSDLLGPVGKRGIWSDEGAEKQK